MKSLENLTLIENHVEFPAVKPKLQRYRSLSRISDLPWNTHLASLRIPAVLKSGTLKFGILKIQRAFLNINANKYYMVSIHEHMQKHTNWKLTLKQLRSQNIN